MKISFLFFAALLVATPLSRTWADDPAPAAPTDGTTPATGDGTSHCHGGKLHGALRSLDLSQQQKDQIKQIVSSTTDKKERRHQIWAVLTPGQQAKLKALRQEHKGGAGTTADPADS